MYIFISSDSLFEQSVLYFYLGWKDIQYTARYLTGYLLSGRRIFVSISVVNINVNTISSYGKDKQRYIGFIYF